MTTRAVPERGNTQGRTHVAMPMTEFKDEEPTKPEVTESLSETISRLRTHDVSISERPTVRMRPITKAPPDTAQEVP